MTTPNFRRRDHPVDLAFFDRLGGEALTLLRHRQPDRCDQQGSRRKSTHDCFHPKHISSPLRDKSKISQRVMPFAFSEARWQTLQELDQAFAFFASPRRRCPPT